MNRAKKIDLCRFEESSNLYYKVNALYDILKELIEIIDYNNENIDLDRFSIYGLEQIDQRIKELTKTETE